MVKIRLKKEGMPPPDPLHCIRGHPQKYLEVFSQMLTHECLRLANEAVEDRRQIYGQPENNLTRMADLASPLVGLQVTPIEAVLICIAQKMSRLVESPTHEDTWVDIAGWAACGYEIAKRMEQEEDDSDE
jgi:hypothetical protein